MRNIDDLYEGAGIAITLKKDHVFHLIRYCRESYEETKQGYIGCASHVGQEDALRSILMFSEIEFALLSGLTDGDMDVDYSLAILPPLSTEIGDLFGTD